MNEYVIVVFNSCPEKLEFYKLPQFIANDCVNELMNAHGKYFSSITAPYGHDMDKNPGLKFICDTVYGEDGETDQWLQYKVDMSLPCIVGTNERITAVYHTGFYL